jgi:glutamate dehydrogenase (NAD(P)+)
VAVSDSRGGVYSRNGLDIRALLAHKEKTGSVTDFPGAETITNDELLELDVDILIPAALENVITLDNASRIRARLIAEFANGPVSGDADALLHSRGVLILPDILCNGGGVIVSYFEMVQNFNLDHWDAEEVNRRLEKKMVVAYKAVHDLASKNNVPLRQAGYTIAVGRVVKAMKFRGWV